MVIDSGKDLEIRDLHLPFTYFHILPKFRLWKRMVKCAILAVFLNVLFPLLPVFWGGQWHLGLN